MSINMPGKGLKKNMPDKWIGKKNDCHGVSNLCRDLPTASHFHIGSETIACGENSIGA